MSSRRVAWVGALGMVAVAFWSATSAGQKPVEPACEDPAPYVPQPAYSGAAPNLPAVPTLAHPVMRDGARFTVVGAVDALRDGDPRSTTLEKEIAVVGQVADDAAEALPACTAAGWPKGDGVCHLRLEGGGAHVLVLVDGKTKTSGGKPASGDAIVVTGRYAAGHVVGETARYDPIWGVLLATEVGR